MGKVTIRDIARAAGVSPSAVSFTLNDRPGVSDETKKRIAKVAESMGWIPNKAAQSLSAQTAGAIGLVIGRPQSSFAPERFFLEFIIGLQDIFITQDYALVIQLAKSIDVEIETYKRWHSRRIVDGVIVIDPRHEDPRPRELLDMHLPAVFTGQPAEGLGSVVGNEEGILCSIMNHLVETGRKRIAYVRGFQTLEHTVRRANALSQLGKSKNVETLLGHATDFTATASAEATAEILNGPKIPDAFIFDNEILTLGGYESIRSAGFEIGKDIAVVSCEDSDICRILAPKVTSIHRDPALLGTHAAKVLLSMLDGNPPESLMESTPELIIRESTAK